MNLGIGIGLGFHRGTAGVTVPTFPTMADVDLATFAEDYALVNDMETVGDWSYTPHASVTVTQDASQGFESLAVTRSDGNDRYFVFDYGSQIPLKRWLVFRQYISDAAAVWRNRLVAWDASDVKVFETNLTHEVGGGPDPFTMYRTGLNWWQFDLDAVALLNGKTLADVTKIGFNFARRNGFDPVTFWTGRLETVDLRPMVSIRFDDCRASVYDVAFPLMSARSLPGVVATITGQPNLQNTGTVNGYGGPWMTLAELEEVRDDGWDIANHTVNHFNLTTLDGETLEGEMADAAAYLAATFGQTYAPYMLCSPYGGHDAETFSVAQGVVAGYGTSTSGANTPLVRPVQAASTFTAGNHWYNQKAHQIDNATAATVNAVIDNAVANDQWLVLLLHDVGTGGGALQMDAGEFEDVLDHIVASAANLDFLTITGVIERMKGL